MKTPKPVAKTDVSKLLAATTTTMNTTKVAKKRSTMSERAKELREAFWPEIGLDELWHRKRNDGYATIPRTLAIVMAIIDSLSKNKPAGHTYFVLWCRAWDEPLLTIDTPSIFAAETGFTGERALVTWRQRMKTLRELGFIDTKPGASGEYHYVLILNPHLIVRKLKPRIQTGIYMRLFERGQEIGASDITNPTPIKKPKAEPKKVDVIAKRPVTKPTAKATRNK